MEKMDCECPKKIFDLDQASSIRVFMFFFHTVFSFQMFKRLEMEVGRICFVRSDRLPASQESPIVIGNVESFPRPSFGCPGKY